MSLTVEELTKTKWRKTMTTYNIYELQNAQSLRDGARIKADSLTAAKRKASQMQMFQGTVMVIENLEGSIAARKEDGKWANV